MIDPRNQGCLGFFGYWVCWFLSDRVSRKKLPLEECHIHVKTDSSKAIYSHKQGLGFKVSSLSWKRHLFFWTWKKLQWWCYFQETAWLPPAMATHDADLSTTEQEILRKATAPFPSPRWELRCATSLLCFPERCQGRAQIWSLMCNINSSQIHPLTGNLLLCPALMSSDESRCQ